MWFEFRNILLVPFERNVRPKAFTALMEDVVSARYTELEDSGQRTITVWVTFDRSKLTSVV